MKLSEKNTVALVFGRKHCGKTTLLKKMIGKISKNKSVLIIDKLGRFKDLGGATFYRSDQLFEFMHSQTDKFFVTLNTTDEGHIRAALVGAYMNGNISIFYDEADSTFGVNTDKAVKDVILRGRNQGIDLVLTALRPVKIGPDTRNQADLIYCYHVVNREYIKSLAQEFGRPDAGPVIENLNYKNYEYIKLDISNNSLEIFTNKKTLPDREGFFNKFKIA